MSESKVNGTAYKESVSMDLGAAPIKEAEFNGRVYHDDHFDHGVLLGRGGDGASVQGNGQANGQNPAYNGYPSGNLEPDRGAEPERLAHRNTGTLIELQRPSAPGSGTMTMAPQVTLGTPMPKWPAGHQSAAFEAVSIKKSYILSPAEIYAECAHHGEEKAKYPWHKVLLLSIAAGFYVGFGFTVCLIVGGNLNVAPGIGTDADQDIGTYKLIFGAFGFPFGFTTIVVCGAELYTSLCAYMTAAWWEGKVSALTVLRMLFISWWGNFIGCVIMAGLFHKSSVYEHGRDTTLKILARDKVSHTWGATLIKGIFANWLVAIATWMANAAQDLTGKFVGIWLPISAFAAVGLEHCIANQFLYPLAWFQGAEVSAKEFIWHNEIPATLGNYIGGGVCIATTYAFIYGRTPKRIEAWISAKLKKA